MNDRGRKFYLLSHAGRKGINDSVALLLHAAEIQNLMGASQAFDNGQTRKRCRILYDFDARHAGDIAILFGHVSDLVANRAALAAQLMAEHSS